MVRHAKISAAKLHRWPFTLAVVATIYWRDNDDEEEDAEDEDDDDDDDNCGGRVASVGVSAYGFVKYCQYGQFLIYYYMYTTVLVRVQYVILHVHGAHTCTGNGSDWSTVVGSTRNVYTSCGVKRGWTRRKNVITTFYLLQTSQKSRVFTGNLPFDPFYRLIQRVTS